MLVYTQSTVGPAMRACVILAMMFQVLCHAWQVRLLHGWQPLKSRSQFEFKAGKLSTGVAGNNSHSSGWLVAVVGGDTTSIVNPPPATTRSSSCGGITA